MVRAWRRGRALEFRALPTFGRTEPGPSGGPPAHRGVVRPTPWVGGSGPPFRGRTPPTSTAPGPVLPGARTTALSADDSLSPDSRGLPPSPLTVSGGRPTAYRVLPGGRYPRAVCTALWGHGSTPVGLVVTKTKPHADGSSMRFWSPCGRALYNRSGVTGLSWIYRDYSLCGRHSACRYHRQA